MLRREKRLTNLSLNVVDLFCGAGGLSLGFQKAGFDLLLAADNDAKAIQTYRKNIGNHAYVEDIYVQTERSIRALIGEDTSIDVVVGGPPCQGFSVQRRGNDVDQRNELVLEFARVIGELKPRVFLMENVSGLLSKRGVHVLQEFKEILGSRGYDFSIKKLDASYFGVPQARKRVFLVGFDTTIFSQMFRFPDPDLSFISSPRTVRDTIADLVNIKDGEVLNHRADKLTEINLARIRSIKAGRIRYCLKQRAYSL